MGFEVACENKGKNHYHTLGLDGLRGGREMKDIFGDGEGKYLANPRRGNTVDMGAGKHKGMQLEEN